MASKEDIKKAILEVAGNPESGAVFLLADKWAEAIVGLDAPVSEGKVVETAKFERPTKETRTTKADETR
jgi:hypothetical protein